MYCPKCKEGFEEGSRRFCPTDGARLISEIAGAGGHQAGGIFANLIPKIEAISDLNKSTPEIPHFLVAEPTVDTPNPFAKQNTTPEAFFELEDLPPEPIATIIEAPPVEAVEPEIRPVARKINAFEIPAGHVELGGAGRTSGLAAEFDRSDPESFIGRNVKGRYKITEFLGDDETGLAYLADDQIVEDKKVMVRILIDDSYDEIMNSILAEERISLAHLDHPNVARLIDSGQFTNGTHFLISEHFDALSVDDILTINGRFDPLRAARILRQAAYGLNEAHQEGIIHRDLRPDNLIIDTSTGDAEQTRVVSFGASNGDPNEDNVDYRAPEVLDGRIATVASDIFSLAVVGYEMLTGQMPFSGSTAKEIVRSQYAGVSSLPTEIRPELPKSVDDILSRALAYNAADRYPKARDLGDALYSALAEPTERISETAEPIVAGVESATPHAVSAPLSTPEPVVNSSEVISLEPAVTPTPAIPSVEKPAWMNRSQEWPEVGTSRSRAFIVAGILAIFAATAFGLYYFLNDRTPPVMPPENAQMTAETNLDPQPPVANNEMPPMPRSIPQPSNSTFYQNSKQNVRGDLLRNFVGFALYYPSDWKINGPQEGAAPNARGKFLDISRPTAGGGIKEQMLVGYYPSKGTFLGDADKFPLMVKETNDTLTKLLPGYQMVSQGEIKVNGDWRAYEIKFQGGGTSDSGEKLVLWGRRLFIPAARPGARNGFEITMLATSLADDVRNVDDVGVRGELSSILYSFEPSQNF